MVGFGEHRLASAFCSVHEIREAYSHNRALLSCRSVSYPLSWRAIDCLRGTACHSGTTALYHISHFLSSLILFEELINNAI